MTANEISERVAAAEAELDRVHKAACNGSQAWRVSIPVNEQRDSDVLIGNGLSAVKELLAEVERLQTALAVVERERDAAVAANATAQSILGEAAKTLMLAREGSREWEHRCGVVKRRISDYLEQAARQHDAAEGSGGA